MKLVRETCVVASLVALLCAGCATLANPPTSSGDDSGVQDQLFKLQKDSASLLEKVDKLEKSLGDRSAGGACAEAAARSQNMEKELRVLEEQLLATQKRLDEVLAELRVQRRGGGGVAGPLHPPDLAPPAESGAGPTSGSTSASGAPPVAGVPAPSAGSQEALFNGAYADYSRGNYDLALTGFDAALRADPQGPLADDAQYWIGETLYAKGQRLEAAAAYDKVITGWPKGDKLALARLKKGFALYEGKRTAEGVLELQRVIQTWPTSDEARLARDFLRRKGVVGD